MQSTLELTARGRLCLVLLHLTAGAAWLTGDDNARLAAAMLVAPVLIDLLYKQFRAPRLSLRIAPRRTQARTAFLETVELHNESTRRSAFGLGVTEPRTSTIAGGSYVAVLGPGESMRVQLAARSRRRTITEERAFVVDTLHPLGMFRWRAVITRPAQMIVEPARTELDVATLRALDVEQRQTRTGAQPEQLEYFSLREYRLGEDARHVQAARSAAVGALVTKVYRGQQDPECALVLDLRRPPGAPQGLSSHGFERHLSVTASIVEGLLSRGASVHGTAIGRDIDEFHIDSPNAAAEFMTYLAAAHTVAYYAMPQDLLERLPRRDACFWIPAGDYRVAPAQLDARWQVVREAAS